MGLPDLNFNSDSGNGVFIAFGAIAVWSSLPLTLRLFVTLKRHGGIYFWAILATTWGLCIREIGYILRFLAPSTPLMLGAIMAQGGWISMVLGFSIVLYSRLNLILDNPKIRRRILIMIIVNGCIFYPFMATLSIGLSILGSRKSPDYAKWVRVMTPMERIQIVFILSQENIISFFYMRAAYQYLRNRSEDHGKTRNAMLLLFSVQIVILIVDLAILVLDFAGLLALKLFIHSFVYSVKLELEFVVLNQLVEISQLGIPGLPSTSYDPSRGNKHIDSKFPSGNLGGAELTPAHSPEPDSLFDVESYPTYRSSTITQPISESDQELGSFSGNVSDSTLRQAGIESDSPPTTPATNYRHDKKWGTTICVRET